MPFFDNDGNTYLANPDGSEDRVALDRRSRIPYSSPHRRTGQRPLLLSHFAIDGASPRTFIDGNSDYGHIVALHISKSQTHKVVDNPPQWFKEQFEELFGQL